MISTRNSAAVVGLDVQAGSIAAAEVRKGAPGLGRSGVAPLGPELTREGEVSDPAGLGAALRALFAQHKLGRNVRVGVANQRVVVRTLRMPLIEDAAEIETAVRFRAQDQIPMPLEQSVMDYRVVRRGAVSEDGERSMDVIFVAARRDMISPLLEAVRGAGLKPLGIDLSAFGMVRALAPEAAALSDGGADHPSGDEQGDGLGEHHPARLYCNLGDVTNIAVAVGPMCLFTRAVPFGMEGIAQRLAERCGLAIDHARQWLLHVGLERSLETITEDKETVLAARETLADGAARLADELRMSLEFYGAQDGVIPVESVIACGPGTVIEGLTARLGRELGRPVTIGRPRALGHLDDDAAARLTLSYGLALEE